MIVPAIDIQGGQAVQLVGGKDLAIEAGDPASWAERFGCLGDVAVVDLDAAMGTGDNRAVIEPLLRTVPCRVGGGIRDYDTAVRWLDAGAETLVLGTAATPELLSQLPRQRVCAALDAVDGEVVVEGWTTRTGASIVERMEALRPYVSSFLVTFVEREGRMQGTDHERVAELLAHVGDARLTVAGGITTPEEVAALDALGVDCQVGMALYSGTMSLGQAFAACAKTDRPDALVSTVVCDRHERALGLVYSSRDTLAEMVDTRVGVYHSRRRGRWVKGETSGATQAVHRVAYDCDRDAVRVMVDQTEPGFCHLDTWTCWGPATGLPALARTLATRVANAPEGSYTARLLNDPGLLAAKLREEAAELAEADTPADVAHEVADVVYFALVAAARSGVSLAQVEAELDRRARRITRRRGDAKEPT